MRTTLGLIAATVVLAVISMSAAGPAVNAADGSPFAGFGTWIDIYDGRAYASPEATASGIAARGVTTAYLETSNFKQPVDIVKPARLGRLIEALHGFGIKTVAWYLPGFIRPQVDLRRSLAAIAFRSASGQAFDGFALDIEARNVRSVPTRNLRLLDLSRKVREAAGADYVLGAITPSPRDMERRLGYWTPFPWPELAAFYDVFLPMSYSSGRVSGPDGTYGYQARALALIRRQVGDPDVSIHLIGGVANRLSATEVQSFANVVGDDGRLLGWSMYDYFTTTPAAWTALKAVVTS